MERRIIQIQTVLVPTSFNNPGIIVYALCDDGTLWSRRNNDPNRNWIEIEEKIPQLPIYINTSSGVQKLDVQS